MRPITVAALIAAALLGVALWFTSTKRIDSSEPLPIESAESESRVSEPAPTELADPDAPVVTASDVHAEVDDERVALASEAQPEVVAVVDTSKPTAALEFSVVDERSGLNLSRFLVRVSDTAGRKIEVVTDDRGRAVSEPLALGGVTVIPIDHEKRRSQPAPIAIEHIESPSRPHVVSVASGATYRVAFGPENGPDPESITLRITLDNEEGNSATTSFEVLRTREPYRHESESAWIRFPALDETLTRARRIEARSRDGLWSGAANATVAVGEATQPVRIEMEACGIVKGRVTCAGAAAVEVVVVFRAEPDKGQGRAYTVSTRTDSSGNYKLEFVRPRSATMRLTSLLYEPTTRDIELIAGETTVQDFDLVGLPTVGRVAGTILSESGTYETKVDVTLVRSGNERGDVPRMRRRVRWTSVAGRRVGEFDFGLLAKGKYRVECERVDWFEWTPRRLDVEAPKDDIVVRIADRSLVADFAIEVRDADNGLPLNRAHLVLETIDGERMRWIDSGDVVVWGYPEDKRLRWRLDKTGYPSRIGDAKSFEVTTIVEGRRRRTVEILVQPEWSEVVRVTHGKDEKPLENALVSIDGREAGKTDKTGQLRVSAREKPQSITAALAGWRLEGGVDLRAPAQRNWRRFLDVRMRPTKKK
ncbi:MAG: carboxypeptidase-like regulatory domain-containing protein [Planctomycetota bacterium]|nr:carboxypeptidase-like regulatory domain-containing protein [Planctomycetota bacterium]